MPNDLNISLSGPEFEPAGDAWVHASEAERRAYWARLAEIAYEIKRREIARGIGADGEPLAPVRPSGRRDHADGPPLAPHDEASRTARLLDYTSTADGATLFWRASGRQSWAVILGYHARIGGEVKGAPVRDTLGISDRGRQQIAAQARQSWAAQHGPAARGAVPKAPVAPRHPKIPTLKTNAQLAAEAGARAAPGGPTVAAVEAQFGVKFVPSAGAKDRRRYETVLVDVAKVDADLAKGRDFHVGPGGTGAAIAGRYQEFLRFLDKARREGIPIEMPRVTIADATGAIAISDGRHRFAAFRDLGARYLPVSVPKGRAREVRRRYGPEA